MGLRLSMIRRKMACMFFVINEKRFDEHAPSFCSSRAAAHGCQCSE